MSVPVALGNASFMVTPARTLQRIVAIVPAGASVSISHDFDRTPTVSSPTLVSAAGGPTNDLAIVWELNMKLPAGTTLQQQGSTQAVTLIFD